MWLKRYLVIKQWVYVAGVVLLLLGCSFRDDVTEGAIPGYIGTAEPIVGAYIDVYAIDGVTGEFLSPYPVYTTDVPSNSDGEFAIPNAGLSGALLFVARGGEVTEYWSSVPAPLGSQHLTAVVGDMRAGSARSVIITPWTTLVHELATGRRLREEDQTFMESIDIAEDLLYAHFIGAAREHSRQHCFSRLNCLRPAPLVQFSDRENARESDAYTLTLVSLSARAAANQRTTKESNSVLITSVSLARDARDGRLDGLTVDGWSETTKDTLRAELGRAFAAYGLEAFDHRYSYGDFSLQFDRIASNTNPDLFGDTTPSPLDLDPPRVSPVHSAILDERDDRIIFDDNRMPQRIHDLSSVIRLETMFEPGCPEIHKHVDLLQDAAPASNPLRWRFAVYDEISGVADIHANVSIGPVMRDVSVVIADERLPDGGYDVSVTATSATVPELVSREGEFKIAIRVIDHSGNESTPLEGCWWHVPRAAPLWVGPMVPPDGPGSMLDYSLEQDNLSPLLNGEQLPYGSPVLASFEVFNPNDMDVYLVMNPVDVAGEFSWTWSYDYVAGSLDLGLDSCIQQGTCTASPPQIENRYTLYPNPALPVNNLTLTVDGSSCGEDCSDWVLQLEPGTSVAVDLRWSSFDHFLPPDIMPGELIELFDPEDGQGLATGTSREYVHCLNDNGDGSCTDRQFYDERITMRAAMLHVQGAVAGETAAVPSLATRKPVGREHTFGTAPRFSQNWITNED